MHAKHINPILNVSDLAQSFAWFAKLGWGKTFDWGDPPSFGSVGSGECEIFLCLDGQGGRGRGPNAQTFGPDGDETGDRGVWLTIWVDEVASIYRHCLEQELDVTWPPTDMPWGVRELHVRHPDGHVFRLSQRLHRA
jgi:catechol 2,3-dioxygenase-like lactoylglutathione lyase family enzyme